MYCWWLILCSRFLHGVLGWFWIWITVEPLLLTHLWLVYHGYLERVLETQTKQKAEDITVLW